MVSSVNGAPVQDLEPHNTDAEEAVLGAVLVAGRIPDSVTGVGLAPEHFYFSRYAQVFAAMIALHARGSEIDAGTVADELSRKDFDQASARASVAALSGPVPGIAAVGEHARIICQHAHARSVRRVAGRLQRNSFDRQAREDLRQLVASTPPSSAQPRTVTLKDYLALPREPVEPYVTHNEGRSVLLGRETVLLVAGPSGVGKSLAALDLAGLLASDDGGFWVGMQVRGGLRVLLVSLEGSDEDTVDRLRALVPDEAASRLMVDDRWRADGTTPTLHQVAATVRAEAIDVVLIDTWPAFLSDRWDLTGGVPEQAFEEIETARRLAGRPVAFVLVVHTRKGDRRASSPVDELEELAGTFHKKADGVVLIRRDGGDLGPRRIVKFPKTRRGPEPPAKVTTLPDDPDAAPRLMVLADVKPRLKEGTEAERIAEWIGKQPEPVPVSVLAAALEISDDTLRRRRDELGALGIKYAKPPGAVGNSRAYGTADQWRRSYGLMEAEA